MKIENVEEFIKLLNENDLSELTLKTDEFELKLKKENQVREVVTQTLQPAAQPATFGATTQGGAHADEEAGEKVKSPIVGVVYLSPEPGQPPYVTIGERVKKGQKLAIISAMKVMNDFVSPVDGIIKDIKVQNEDVVEFDQVLFIIE